MPDKLDEQAAAAMAKTNADVSEAQIAVHWKEEEYYYPTAKFVGQANLTDPSINERFSALAGTWGGLGVLVDTPTVSLYCALIGRSERACRGKLVYPFSQCSVGRFADFSR